MRTLLIHGASTAAGWYDMERAGWASRLHQEALQVNRVNPQEAVVVQNTSIPGNTLLGVMKDLEGVSKYKKLGTVTAILAIGLNESKIMAGRTRPLVSLDRFQDALGSYSDQVEAQGGNVLFLGTEALRESTIVTENGNTFEDDLVAEYDYILETIAAERGYPYVSMVNTLSRLGLENTVSADGYHPNALGHKAICEALKVALAPYESFSTGDIVPQDITRQLVQ